MKYIITIFLALMLAVPALADKMPQQEKEKAKIKKVKKADSDKLKAYLQSKGKTSNWVVSGVTDVELADLLRQNLGASIDEKQKKEKAK